MATKDDYGSTKQTAFNLALLPTPGVYTSKIGHVEALGDHDWFKVHLVADKPYTFTLGGVVGSPSLKAKAELLLRDISGNLISGQGTSNSKIFVPKVTGDYYLDVGAKADQGIGAYTVKATQLVDDYGNSQKTATPIILKTGAVENYSSGQVSGFINYNGDTDWFKINITAGKTYEFLNANGSINSIHISPELVDASGNLVKDGMYFKPTQSGSYFLKFSYQKLDFLEVEYDIDISSYIDEAGSSLATAKAIAAIPTLEKPLNISGRMLGIDDFDWYSIELKTGHTYGLTANPVRLDIQIVDAANKVVFAQNWTNMLAPDKLNFTVPADGKYYIRLNSKDYDSGALVPNQPYNLNIADVKRIIGTSHDNTLNGGVYRDIISGAAGNDKLNGNAGDDILSGDSGNDVLKGGSGNDDLLGGSGDDLLQGHSGNDHLDGGIGKDTINGGFGNDTYIVDNVEDVVIETSAVATDIDSIESTVSYTLPENVENIQLKIGASLAGGSRFAVGNNLDNNFSFYNFQGPTNGTVTLEGGLGKDTYELAYQSKDTLRIHQGDSLVNSFDVVKGGGFTEGDILDLESNTLAADVVRVDGKNFGNLHSHHISKGIISFDDLDNYASPPLSLTNSQLADAIKYVQANITHKGDTVAFAVSNDGINDIYVFQDGGAVDTLVRLVGIYSTQMKITPDGGGFYLV